MMFSYYTSTSTALLKQLETKIEEKDFRLHSFSYAIKERAPGESVI